MIGVSVAAVITRRLAECYRLVENIYNAQMHKGAYQLSYFMEGYYKYSLIPHLTIFVYIISHYVKPF